MVEHVCSAVLLKEYVALSTGRSGTIPLRHTQGAADSLQGLGHQTVVPGCRRVQASVGVFDVDRGQPAGDSPRLSSLLTFSGRGQRGEIESNGTGLGRQRDQTGTVSNLGAFTRCRHYKFIVFQKTPNKRVRSAPTFDTAPTKPGSEIFSSSLLGSAIGLRMLVRIKEHGEGRIGGTCQRSRRGW